MERWPSPSTRPPAADARVGAGTTRRRQGSFSRCSSDLRQGLRSPSCRSSPGSRLQPRSSARAAFPPWSSGRTTFSWTGARSQGSCSRRPAPMVVCGIGINVNQEQGDLPSGTRLPSTSLRIADGSHVRPGCAARCGSRRARAPLRRLARCRARRAARRSRAAERPQRSVGSGWRPGRNSRRDRPGRKADDRARPRRRRARRERRSRAAPGRNPGDRLKPATAPRYARSPERGPLLRRVRVRGRVQPRVGGVELGIGDQLPLADLAHRAGARDVPEAAGTVVEQRAHSRHDSHAICGEKRLGATADRRHDGVVSLVERSNDRTDERRTEQRRVDATRKRNVRLSLRAQRGRCRAPRAARRRRPDRRPRSPRAAATPAPAPERRTPGHPRHRRARPRPRARRPSPRANRAAPSAAPSGSSGRPRGQPRRASPHLGSRACTCWKPKRPLMQRLPRVTS